MRSLKEVGSCPRSQTTCEPCCVTEEVGFVYYGQPLIRAIFPLSGPARGGIRVNPQNPIQTRRDRPVPIIHKLRLVRSRYTSQARANQVRGHSVGRDR